MCYLRDSCPRIAYWLYEYVLYECDDILGMNK